MKKHLIAIGIVVLLLVVWSNRMTRHKQRIFGNLY